MKLQHALTDYHHGQTDGHIIARAEDGEPRGLLEFSLFCGQVFINWIITHHQHRRQGIGTALVEKLATEYPCPLVWGATTPDGTALRNAMETGKQRD